MGYTRHNAIVVSSSYGDYGDDARKKAIDLGMNVSDVVTSPVNGIKTFLVCPDGSEEDWPESDEGDSRRETFKAWLDEQRYGDGSSPLSWVEVQYGDDDQVTAVISHSDEPARQVAGILNES